MPSGRFSIFTDEEFVKSVNTIGVTATARAMGIGTRSAFLRQSKLRTKRPDLVSPWGKGNVLVEQVSYPDHIPLTVKDGIVLVGSDLHIWPGERSTAIRAFINFIKEHKPKAVILNGDVMDFPRISRHAPIGWEKNPQPADEIEAAQDILHDIEQTAGRGVRKLWLLGNHDARFESRIAAHNPEYARIKGLHLHDHFPNYERGWMAIINDDVAIKHRYKSGQYAPYNNTLHSGKNIITGHLHSQNIIAHSDLNGTRYGMDTGCMADVYSAAFRNYTEENPRNWRAGFGFLTFKNGRYLPPELVTVIDKKTVAFRGSLITV